MARKRNQEQPAGGTDGLQNLDAKRVAALGLLLQGETPPATARALGVSRITVWRWVKKDPEFGAVLAELQADLTEDVQKGLRNLSRAAMDNHFSPWRGTAVGVDFILAEGYDWNHLFNRIREAFRLNTSSSRGTDGARRPRFED